MNATKFVLKLRVAKSGSNQLFVKMIMYKKVSTKIVAYQIQNYRLKYLTDDWNKIIDFMSLEDVAWEIPTFLLKNAKSYLTQIIWESFIIIIMNL